MNKENKMIEIISKKFKASDTDQRFMDWCAEVERDEPKTWKGHTIEKIRCWGLIIKISQLQIFQI